MRYCWWEPECSYPCIEVGRNGVASQLSPSKVSPPPRPSIFIYLYDDERATKAVLSFPRKTEAEQTATTPPRDDEPGGGEDEGREEEQKREEDGVRAPPYIEIVG